LASCASALAALNRRIGRIGDHFHIEVLSVLWPAVGGAPHLTSHARLSAGAL
jgi:hypothetical protein